MKNGGLTNRCENCQYLAFDDNNEIAYAKCTAPIPSNVNIDIDEVDNKFIPIMFFTTAKDYILDCEAWSGPVDDARLRARAARAKAAITRLRGINPEAAKDCINRFEQMMFQKANISSSDKRAIDDILISIVKYADVDAGEGFTNAEKLMLELLDHWDEVGDWESVEKRLREHLEGKK